MKTILERNNLEKSQIYLNKGWPNLFGKFKKNKEEKLKI